MEQPLLQLPNPGFILTTAQCRNLPPPRAYFLPELWLLITTSTQEKKKNPSLCSRTGDYTSVYFRIVKFRVKNALRPRTKVSPTTPVAPHLGGGTLDRRPQRLAPSSRSVFFWFPAARNRPERSTGISAPARDFFIQIPTWGSLLSLFSHQRCLLPSLFTRPGPSRLLSYGSLCLGLF